MLFLSGFGVLLTILITGTFYTTSLRKKNRQIQEQSEQLETSYATLETTHQHLKKTQAQLIQSEKMASLGQLTAGIAHEIKNPLNFINNFADLAGELTDELLEEIENNADQPVATISDNIEDILTDLKTNVGKIVEHGQRADGIVQSMMQHASGADGKRVLTSINSLLDEYISLAQYGLNSTDDEPVVHIERHFAPDIGEVALHPQEMGQVFLNLLNNAIYAVQQYQNQRGPAYTPRIWVQTHKHQRQVEIRIRDNGPGIDPEQHNKIFEPFYTTQTNRRRDRTGAFPVLRYCNPRP